MAKRDRRKESTPRFAYLGLDRVIHERARLSVLTSLITHSKGLPFGDLKRLCALTDGNLNRHLQVLEQARDLVGGGSAIAGTAHTAPYSGMGIKREIKEGF